MNTNTIEKHFDRMGIQVSIERSEPRPRWLEAREPADYSLDVRRDSKGEKFVMSVPVTLEDSISVEIHAQPEEEGGGSYSAT